MSIVHGCGEPIDSLIVEGLPPGAVFTPGPDNTTGELTWLPGTNDIGTHVVIFTAHSALTTSDTTEIHVIEATTDAPGDVAAARLPPRVVPNPIRHSGHLRFALARAGPLRVDVFDLTGRLVGTPVNDVNAEADHTYAQWYDVYEFVPRDTATAARPQQHPGGTQ